MQKHARFFTALLLILAIAAPAAASSFEEPTPVDILRLPESVAYSGTHGLLEYLVTWDALPGIKAYHIGLYSTYHLFGYDIFEMHIGKDIGQLNVLDEDGVFVKTIPNVPENGITLDGDATSLNLAPFLMKINLTTLSDEWHEDYHLLMVAEPIDGGEFLFQDIILHDPLPIPQNMPDTPPDTALDTLVKGHSFYTNFMPEQSEWLQLLFAWRMEMLEDAYVQKALATVEWRAHTVRVSITVDDEMPQDSETLRALAEHMLARLEAQTEQWLLQLDPVPWPGEVGRGLDVYDVRIIIASEENEDSEADWLLDQTLPRVVDLDGNIYAPRVID